jgi:hypothetical protein
VRALATLLPLAVLVACSSTTHARRDYSASDLVTSKTYTRLVFEVHAVTGDAPRQAALSALQTQLDTLRESGHLGKPGGVSILLGDALPVSSDPGHAWTADELDALGAAQASYAAAAGEAVVQVLYVDGHSSDDNGQNTVLGVAHGHDLVVVFKKTLDASCAHPGTDISQRLVESLCTLTEGSVLLHEVGHVFGLVNRGLPMTAPHQDSSHGAHDASEACIMYYASEATSLVTVLADRVKRGQTSSNSFDDACLADLAAAQGK